MRRGEIFWGALLVILGVLFFLKAAGYLAGDVVSWFWPILVIAIGILILLGGFSNRNRFENAEKFSVPMQGAQEARLSIDHAAGRIDLRAGAEAGNFLTCGAGSGMNHSSRVNGNRLEVEIQAGPSFLPFVGPEGGVWRCLLNPELPTMIKIHAGASRLDLDLSDLRVTSFSFEGGASGVNLILPARMEHTLIELEAGAANIDLTVPEGVAMRFRTKSVGSLTIDDVRFPRREDGLYQSPDFDTARYHAEVSLDGGATSIKVR